MRVSASGWSRNCGTHEICNVALEDLACTKCPTMLNAHRPSLYESEDELVFVTRSYLTLNGNFAVEVRLTKLEIVKLVRDAFSNDEFLSSLMRLEPQERVESNDQRTMQAVK